MLKTWKVFCSGFLSVPLAAMAEWLRRLTRNQIGSSRVGSNPTRSAISQSNQAQISDIYTIHSPRLGGTKKLEIKRAHKTFRLISEQNGSHLARFSDPFIQAKHVFHWFQANKVFILHFCILYKSYTFHSPFLPYWNTSCASCITQTLSKSVPKIWRECKLNLDFVVIYTQQSSEIG